MAAQWAAIFFNFPWVFKIIAAIFSSFFFPKDLTVISNGFIIFHGDNFPLFYHILIFLLPLFLFFEIRKQLPFSCLYFVSPIYCNCSFCLSVFCNLNCLLVMSLPSSIYFFIDLAWNISVMKFPILIYESFSSSQGAILSLNFHLYWFSFFSYFLLPIFIFLPSALKFRISFWELFSDCLLAIFHLHFHVYQFPFRSLSLSIVPINSP